MRRSVLQILREERTRELLTEILAGIAVEANRAEGAALFDFLTVMPGAEDELDLVVRVFGLDGLVDGDGSVNVLLIPQAGDQHGGDRRAAASARSLSTAWSLQKAS